MNSEEWVQGTLDEALGERAFMLRLAAEAIDRETRQLRDDGVLEPDGFRPCRDASDQLRHMASIFEGKG